MNDDLIKRLERWGESESLQNHFIGSRSARKDCAEAAAALVEARAEVERLRGLVPNPDETPDEIVWRDYMRGVHPDLLAKQRKVTRERMRLMLRRITERRAALEANHG